MPTRYYVGRKPQAAGRIVFKAPADPTPDTHPQFASVVGPFRTKRAAILCAVTYPNPHIRSVSDAERIATPAR